MIAPAAGSVRVRAAASVAARGDRATITDVGEHAAAFGPSHVSNPDLGVQGDPHAQGCRPPAMPSRRATLRAS